MQRPAASRGRVRWRQWGWGTLALALALLTARIAGDLPGPLPHVQAAAHPYRFNLAVWTAAHLWDLPPRSAAAEGPAAVERYFALAQELRAADRALVRAQATAPAQDGDVVRQALARRDAIRTEMARLEPLAHWELQRRVGYVLRSEGLFPRLPLGGEGSPSVAFPPVAFTLEEAPRALVVSPRERIELLERIQLRADITVDEITALEETLERRGLSALVEPIGGLSTYPAIVAPTSDLRSALAGIVHEWTHHYLFFQPLGQRYGVSGEMASINETAANIVGDEVAARLLGQSPPLLAPTPPSRPPEEASAPPAFDARRVLHETRLEAERLLAEGRVEEAEALMEAQRRLLAEHGVFIRKLNQAYYAFHGTYADSPASVSPVFEQLRAFRRAQPSLGAFLRRVALIRSPAELAALAG